MCTAKWMVFSSIWCCLLIPLLLFVVVVVSWNPDILSLLHCAVVEFQPLGGVIDSIPCPDLIKIFFPVMGWGEYQIYFWCCIPFTLVRTSIFFLHSYTIVAHMGPVSTDYVYQSLLISPLCCKFQRYIACRTRNTPVAW